MFDSGEGIAITEASQAAVLSAPPFRAEELSGVGSGTAAGSCRHHQENDQAPLVMPDDKSLVSEYMFELMSNARRVYLMESERVGNRKNLKVNLPGFGCVYCCRTNRRGLSRVFPTRRRALPERIDDLYDHLRRCQLCPTKTKERLASLKHKEYGKKSPNGDGLKTFLDSIWDRLHSGTSSGEISSTR